MNTPTPIVALVADLIFRSRITAEARAAGVELAVIGQPAKLATTDGGALIVDLNLNGAIAAAAQWAVATGNPVIGFVSHVDEQTIAEARAAGIQNVVARSRFVQVLPLWLESQRAKPQKNG